MDQTEFTLPTLTPTSPCRHRSGGRRNRCLAGLVVGATLLGVMGASAVADAAPSSARQIERSALAAGDAGPMRGPEVLSIECDAPAAVAGHRVQIGCSWTLPSTAPTRQLTLWRSVDGAVRERVATFGWPFETSYRDVVPAGTEHVAYAIVGTNSAGELVARSRADRVRLPTLLSEDPPKRVEPAPVVVMRPTTTEAPSSTLRPSRSVPADAAESPAAEPALERAHTTRPPTSVAPRADAVVARRGDDG